MTHNHGLLTAVAIALGIWIASPVTTQAGTAQRFRHLQEIAKPNLECSLVVFTDRDQRISQGQSLTFPEKTKRFWLKVVVENRGVSTVDKPFVIGFRVVKNQ